MAIPSSLADAIREEPGRFTKYLDIDKIAKAKNPYAEMKRQMRSEFGSSKTGRNMLKYIKNHYSLTNKIYKSREIQSKLPDEFKGSYRKNQFIALKGKFESKTKGKPSETGIFVAKKTQSVGQGQRFAYERVQNGQTVKVLNYARSKPRGFQNDEIDFLRRRVGQNAKDVTKVFNQTFRTNRSYDSIRTKIRRLK